MDFSNGKHMVAGVVGFIVLIVGLTAGVWFATGQPDRCEQLGYAMAEDGSCVDRNYWSESKQEWCYREAGKRTSQAERVSYYDFCMSDDRLLGA